MRRPTQKQMQAQVDRFNARHPVGAKVRAWTGMMNDGPGRVGVVASPAYVLSGHTPVVHIAGISGCVALSHVTAEDQRRTRISGGA